MTSLRYAVIMCYLLQVKIKIIIIDKNHKQKLVSISGDIPRKYTTEIKYSKKYRLLFIFFGLYPRRIYIYKFDKDFNKISLVKNFISVYGLHFSDDFEVLFLLKSDEIQILDMKKNFEFIQSIYQKNASSVQLIEKDDEHQLIVGTNDGKINIYSYEKLLINKS